MDEQTAAQIASLSQVQEQPPGVSLKAVERLIASAVGNVSVPKFTWITPVTLADQSTGTEGAWTAVNGGVPAGAISIRTLFELSYSLAAYAAIMQWRTGNGLPEIPVAAIGDNAYYAGRRLWYDVEPDLAGNWEYNMTVSSGNPDWSIKTLGYWM